MRSTEELNILVRALAWNDAFGCYTRPGMEKMLWPEISQAAEWIIYFDVDDMHEINKDHQGYDYADSIIKNVLAITRETDYTAGQWKSGDEFLIVLTKNATRPTLDPVGMVTRLQDEFIKWGMSATFALVPVISLDLSENVQPAIDEVYKQKDHNKRGR